MIPIEALLDCLLVAVVGLGVLFVGSGKNPHERKL
jgi:hypothetical protein